MSGGRAQSDDAMDRTNNQIARTLLVLSTASAAACECLPSRAITLYSDSLARLVGTVLLGLRRSRTRLRAAPFLHDAIVAIVGTYCSSTRRIVAIVLSIV